MEVSCSVCHQVFDIPEFASNYRCSDCTPSGTSALDGKTRAEILADPTMLQILWSGDFERYVHSRRARQREASRRYRDKRRAEWDRHVNEVYDDKCLYCDFLFTAENRPFKIRVFPRSRSLKTFRPLCLKCKNSHAAGLRWAREESD